MHQIVLLTALTATSGLFGGGGRHCGTGRCGRPTAAYSACAPTYASYGCQPRTACAAPSYGCQPGTACGAPNYYQHAAPAPQYMAAPQAASYPSYYYPSAPGCAGGNCYRR